MVTLRKLHRRHTVFSPCRKRHHQCYIRECLVTPLRHTESLVWTIQDEPSLNEWTYNKLPYLQLTVLIHSQVAGFQVLKSDGRQDINSIIISILLQTTYMRPDLNVLSQLGLDSLKPTPLSVEALLQNFYKTNSIRSVLSKQQF